MIRFKITPERVSEACNVVEYLNLSAKDENTIVRVAPRFIIDKDGEYIVKIATDEDGDITSFDGYDLAFRQLSQVTPKRLGKLIDEFSEAVKNIVNPPNGKV